MVAVGAVAPDPGASAGSIRWSPPTEGGGSWGSEARERGSAPGDGEKEGGEKREECNFYFFFLGEG